MYLQRDKWIMGETYVIKRGEIWLCVCVWVCVHAERPLTNLKCSWNQFFMLPWTWPLFTWETGRGRRNGQQKNLNWFYYFTLKLEWLIGALSNSEVSFISWQKQHFFFLRPVAGRSVWDEESMRMFDLASNKRSKRAPFVTLMMLILSHIVALFSSWRPVQMLLAGGCHGNGIHRGRIDWQNLSSAARCFIISLLLLLSHLLKSQHTYHFIIQSPISQCLLFNHSLSMGGMTANCRNIYFHVISFSRQ